MTGPKHRGKVDEERREYARRYPNAGAAERNKARHWADSNRAMFHDTICCPACDPKGYSKHAAKHKAAL